MAQENEAEGAEKSGQETVRKALTTIDKPLSDLIKNSKGTLIIFENKEATEARLKALVELYKAEIAEIIAIPELNTAQLAQAKIIRAAYRDTRLELQRVSKHNTSTLNDAKNDNKTEIEKLIEIVSPSEEIIDAKIKTEENRKAEEKRIAEEKETERKRLINQKITDTGIAFERMLLIGKTQEDLDAFDNAVKDFEDNLESLEEFAFEGHELVERVTPRRKEILDRVDAARLQAEKDAELKMKDAELASKAAEQEEKEQALAAREEKLKQAEKKQEREKLLKEKGIEFDRENKVLRIGQSAYSLVVKVEPENENEPDHKKFDDFQDANDDEFKTIIETIEVRQKELSQNIVEYKSLDSEYLQYTGKELEPMPSVTPELLAAVKSAIETGKSAKAQQEMATRNAAIKEVGKIVFPIMEKSFTELFADISPDKIKNEDAKAIISGYLYGMAEDLKKLKDALHQE